MCSNNTVLTIFILHIFNYFVIEYLIDNHRKVPIKHKCWKHEKSLKTQFKCRGKGRCDKRQMGIEIKCNGTLQSSENTFESLIENSTILRMAFIYPAESGEQIFLLRSIKIRQHFYWNNIIVIFNCTNTTYIPPSLSFLFGQTASFFYSLVFCN
jgi:hypothetical protein